MRFQHEDIAQVGHRSKIADHARKTNLSAATLIDTEAQRVLNRPRHNLPRNAFGPIAIGQKTVNHIQTQALTAGADQKLAEPVLHHRFGIHPATGRHAHILPPTPHPRPVERGSGHSGTSPRTPFAKTKPVATRPYTCRASRPWCSGRRGAQRPRDPICVARIPPQRCAKVRARKSDRTWHK